MPEAEPQSQLVTQITPGMFEGCEGFPLLALAAPQADPYGGMAAVHADVHRLDVDREEPRVVGFKPDNLGELLADGLGDAKAAPFIHLSRGLLFDAETQRRRDKRREPF
jgi:hypothetical protein